MCVCVVDESMCVCERKSVCVIEMCVYVCVQECVVRGCTHAMACM